MRTAPKMREFGKSSNENKMSDGGRERPPVGVVVWKSSQKWGVQRSAVRSIAWLDLFASMVKKLYKRCRNDVPIEMDVFFTSLAGDECGSVSLADEDSDWRRLWVR
jgi:hypothetical protein